MADKAIIQYLTEEKRFRDRLMDELLELIDYSNVAVDVHYRALYSIGGVLQGRKGSKKKLAKIDEYLYNAQYSIELAHAANRRRIAWAGHPDTQSAQFAWEDLLADPSTVPIAAETGISNGVYECEEAWEVRLEPLKLHLPGV